MGAADPVRPVHHGQSHLLEVPENQRPPLQHHVEERRERGKMGGGEKEGSEKSKRKKTTEAVERSRGFRERRKSMHEKYKKQIPYLTQI